MMQRHLSHAARYSLLVLGMTALTGCGLISGEHRDSNAGQGSFFASLSFKNIFGIGAADDLNAIAPAAGPISVYDAIAMALHNQLNTRAAMTGDAPSEPLAVLDSGIRAAQKNDDIADDMALALRQQDAAQDIMRAVRIAYARTAIADSLQAEITDALNRPASTPDEVASRAALEKMQNDLGSARVELASLLGVPDPATLVLDPSSTAQGAVPPIAATLGELELLGLSQRIETRNNQTSAEVLRQNAMHAFPGINDILAQNRAGMGPKDAAEWAAFSNPFGRGLVKIFSSDLDLKNTPRQDRIDALRQNAISAAILSQIHIAHAQYGASQKRLETLQAQDEPQGALQNITHRARIYLTQTEAQNHYDSVLTALGIHVLPDDSATMPTMTLAKAIDARSHSMNPVALAHMVAPQSILAMNVEAGLPLEAVRFAPLMTERIPLAQKISVQRDTPAISTPSRFLSISKKQLQSLLNAPISEQ